MPELKIVRFTGAAVTPHLPEVAELRISVFREWPYLYDGDMAYEERYLETYSRSPNSLFVLVFDRERVVGASTGVPMADETEVFRRPIIDGGYDPEKVFYLGESVLLPQYRGRGIGHRFFDEREGYARELGRFTHTAFCAIQRSDDDPRRPHNYRPLNDFWKHRGYVKQKNLTTTLAWREVGAEQETEHLMNFWLRPLNIGNGR